MRKDRVRSEETTTVASRSGVITNQSSRVAFDGSLVERVATSRESSEAGGDADGGASSELSASSLTAAVDAVLESEAGDVLWKLCCFTPAIASIVAGVVLQRRQNRLRRSAEFDAFAYASS